MQVTEGKCRNTPAYYDPGAFIIKHYEYKTTTINYIIKHTRFRNLQKIDKFLIKLAYSGLEDKHTS